jgi:hypothetical protein
MEGTRTTFKRIIHSRALHRGTIRRLVRSKVDFPILEFQMRQQRTQMGTPPAPVSKAGVGLPANGYALVVDGQTKREFDTRDRALKSARELKARFPNLQVKVFDAESRQSETIELAAA